MDGATRLKELKAKEKRNKNNIPKKKYYCVKCETEKTGRNFFVTNNPYIDTNGKLRVCVPCVDSLFQDAWVLYKDFNRAIEEVCKILDIAYVEEIATQIHNNMKEKETGFGKSFGLYKGKYKNHVPNNETRYTTYNCKTEKIIIEEAPVVEDNVNDGGERTPRNLLNINALKSDEKEIIRLEDKWGATDLQELAFLENEYDEWVDNHIVEGKNVEKLVQLICKRTYELNNTTTLKDQKEIQEMLIKLIDTAKLSPKHMAKKENGSLTVGEWIEKMEKDKPIPEADKDLKDVDNVKEFLAWGIGHIGEMVGEKNALTPIYERLVEEEDIKGRGEMSTIGVDDDDSVDD